MQFFFTNDITTFIKKNNSTLTNLNAGSQFGTTMYHNGQQWTATDHTGLGVRVTVRVRVRISVKG